MNTPHINKDDLYMPSEDTFLLLDSIESLSNRIFERTLEIGSGVGIVTEALCKISREVYAIDISRTAILETWRRLKMKGHGGVSHVIEGDLLSMFRETPLFDLIVSNPPYLPQERLYDRTVIGGIEIIKRIIDASAHLTLPKGIIMIVVSSLTSDLHEIKNHFMVNGFHPYIKMSRKLFFEEIIIIEAIREC